MYRSQGLLERDGRGKWISFTTPAMWKQGEELRLYRWPTISRQYRARCASPPGQIARRWGNALSVSAYLHAVAVMKGSGSPTASVISMAGIK